MELNNRKHILAAYGLFRMILGVAQIVGLFSAYFLLEFIVKYRGFFNPIKPLQPPHQQS